MPEFKKIVISMTVDSFLVNQETEELTDNEYTLIISDFLRDKISFPDYLLQGEINEKPYEISLQFLRKSPNNSINNLSVSNV